MREMTANSFLISTHQSFTKHYLHQKNRMLSAQKNGLFWLSKTEQMFDVKMDRFCTLFYKALVYYTKVCSLINILTMFQGLAYCEMLFQEYSEWDFCVKWGFSKFPDRCCEYQTGCSMRCNLNQDSSGSLAFEMFLCWCPWLNYETIWEFANWVSSWKHQWSILLVYFRSNPWKGRINNKL